MKLINFVSELDMNKYSKVQLTLNADDIKIIQPEFDIIDIKTGRHSYGYSVRLKSRKAPITLDVNGYAVIQSFLASDAKYLEMKVKWL